MTQPLNGGAGTGVPQPAPAAANASPTPARLSLAMQAAGKLDLWVAEGDVAYASTRPPLPVHHFAIRSRQFTALLRAFANEVNGRAPRRDAIEDACSQLEAFAIEGGKTGAPAKRVAGSIRDGARW